jgi:hypothetical protein
MAKDPAEIFSVESILAEFSELSDPRSPINRKHLLGEILVVAILAVVRALTVPRRSESGRSVMRNGCALDWSSRAGFRLTTRSVEC